MKRLPFSLIEICQSLTNEGEWQTAKLQLAGNRFARLFIANTGNAYSMAIRVYDKNDKVIENPILTLDVLREKLDGERIESLDKDTLYIVKRHNRDCLAYEEKAKLDDMIYDIIDNTQKQKGEL
ncbi:hypothetical protein LCGC14_0548710 [marine sediment metagenome]|uniref:Uncharacterized protein n=1 Tax=marine sediment metagenome TaxID=412755 RepID=A0A0F9UC26_9ZZZZ